MAVVTGKPRGQRLEEPAWCVKTSHDDSMVGRHQSRLVRVGTEPPFRGGGQAAAWLEKTGAGPTRVALQASHMTSVTAQVSLADTAKLRDGLTSLLEQAGYEGGIEP